LREGPLQVLAERAADRLRGLARCRDQLPERRGVLGQLETLPLVGPAALRLLAEDQELAQVGDDDQPVGLEYLET
jgi:hypothetical protein